MAEILVVSSKIKKYIKDKAGMNTSASVMEELSRHIEKALDNAIASAQAEKRKTVMDRDFEN